MSDRWTRLQDLYLAALDAPADDRPAFVRERADGDAELESKVLAMLAAAPPPALDGDARDVLREVARDALDDLAPGTRVGPYRISEEVGRGGMGTVYRAERADGLFEQTVAVKVVRRGMDSQAVLRRFEAERRILGRLDHPGIARVLDGGLSDDGRPWLAMAFVEGVPITEYTDAHALSVDARLALFEQVCTAVGYAHRQLVVHRDLKPSNVLVTAEGEVKLLDFGIARLLADDDEPVTVLTAPGQFVFTPEYAAPEQVAGGPISTATDVYALGVLLYELLAGRRPYSFDARTPAVIDHVVRTVEPPRPSTVVTETPPTTGATTQRLKRRLAGDLDTICLTALRKEPERRYTSVEAFADDLRRHRDGLPVLARPDTAGYRARKFARRHRAGVAAAAVALAAVVGGAGLALWQAAEARDQRDRAEVEATTAEEVTSFISSLLYSASPLNLRNPDAADARDLRVVDLLEQGAERVEAELEGQPAVQVRLFDVIGEAYRALGDYERAAGMLERAYALSADEALDPDLRAMVTSGLGSLRQHAGDLDAAETLKREALAVLRSSGLDGGVGTGVVLHDLGYVLLLKGAYEEAEPLFQEALAVMRRHYDEGDPFVRTVAGGLADVQRHLGDLDGFEETARAQLASLRQTAPDGDDATATLLGKLGNMLVEDRGDADAGEPYLREALDMRRRIYGDEHPYVAVSLNELAGARLAQGEVGDAVGLYERALAMRRRLLGEGHPHLAYSLVGLGRARLESGRAADAEALFRQAIAVREAALPDGHELTWETRSWLGASLAAQGRRAAAEAELRRAYEALRESRGPDARRTREARERLDALDDA